ncbi:hypothetical protein KQX54_010010 [Cotesia glomerata]|uniref:Uncharacterized protein n=1 Tax=Cotesia glomerata TaxID=32391 RepID=A0AAV7ICP7_COTGL|nr:hypothetical protein KQX54_010010 [Cotesia glomerata]
MNPFKFGLGPVGSLSSLLCPSSAIFLHFFDISILLGGLSPEASLQIPPKKTLTSFFTSVHSLLVFRADLLFQTFTPKDYTSVSSIRLCLNRLTGHRNPRYDLKSKTRLELFIKPEASLVSSDRSGMFSEQAVSRVSQHLNTVHIFIQSKKLRIGLGFTISIRIRISISPISTGGDSSPATVAGTRLVKIAIHGSRTMP